MARLNRNFEEKLRQVVDRAVADRAKDYQKALDSVHRQYSGKPVSVVQPALHRALRRVGLNPPTTQARDWAALISQGQRIVFAPEKSR